MRIRWAHTRLTTKLFVSYLLVAVVGVVTLFVAASLIAPDVFSSAMQTMMPGSPMNGMMGQQNVPLTTTSAALDAAFRDALMRALLVSAALATGAAILLSLFVARQITQPVGRMVAATHRIGGGHYAERVLVPAADRGDELGELANSFNDMAASLENTERYRLELVGDVAHELRTPIATLQGNLEGLLDGVVPPSAETWAKLHTEAGRLRRLVDDLQELSRAEARQIPIEARPVAPQMIVEAAVGRVEPHFAEKGLSLTTPVLSSLPSVLADSDRAVQVLSNLLTNALRYTPATGAVEVGAMRQAGYVAFWVRDNGIGIASDALPQVFDRFYRVDKSRSRALGGSGIGLTIAKALVEAMGGRISAESPGLGRGSTFTFTLPVAP
jgi:signal transduction histidine kinase